MSDYLAGHIKRDPVTGRAVIRTIFSDTEDVVSDKAWLGVTTNRGSFFARTETVAEWDDLYVPVPAE